MGSINNVLRSISGADEEEKRIKERLEILLMAAKAKVQAFRDEINENFLNPGQIDKKQIPGIRAMKYIEQYHVATQNAFSDQVKGHLDHAIDAFFSIGEGNDKGNIKDGLKNVILGALDAFIGSTAVGESEERTYIVIPENNSFVRVDISCWKYNFTQQKILNQHDSAIAYVLCKSVIDHTKLSIDELIYLTTDVLSKSQDVNTYAINSNTLADLSLKSIPNNIDDLKLQFQIMGYDNNYKFRPKGSDVDMTMSEFIASKFIDSKDSNKINKDATIQIETDIKDVTNKFFKYNDIRDQAIKNRFLSYKIEKDTEVYNLSKFEIGFGSYKKTNPASITSVEAYIEELIRVWKKLKADRKED